MSPAGPGLGGHLAPSPSSAPLPWAALCRPGWLPGRGPVCGLAQERRLTPPGAMEGSMLAGAS